MQRNWEGGDAGRASAVCLSVCPRRFRVRRCSTESLHCTWKGSLRSGRQRPKSTQSATSRCRDWSPVIGSKSFDETAELRWRVLCYTSPLSSVGCFRQVSGNPRANRSGSKQPLVSLELWWGNKRTAEAFDVSCRSAQPQLWRCKVEQKEQNKNYNYKCSLHAHNPVRVCMVRGCIEMHYLMNVVVWFLVWEHEVILSLSMSMFCLFFFLLVE